MSDEPPTRSPEADDAPEATGAPDAPPSRLKLWAFRLTALLVVPAVFFVLLEGVLRLTGYGYSTGFFVPAGAAEFRTNQRFAWRFFPPTGAKAPVPARLAGSKPAGTVRVFVFGGSAAMGAPEPAFSFARMLEVMLAESHPGVRFEVVNTAMEGMNSHVVRAIAAEAAALEPDVFVVYAGNNEVVGPYGVADAFRHFTPSLPLIRASMWAKTTRTGQLIGRGVRALGGGREGVWRGMQTFSAGGVRADDPRLDRMREHFRQNLTAVRDAAGEAGAAIVLLRPAANLADCAPLLNLHDPSLSEAQRGQWNEAAAKGRKLLAAGDHAAASAAMRRAVALDASAADGRYLLGRSLLAAGELEAAAEHLGMARDLDGLRVRADSGIGEVCRAVGRTCDAYVDAHALLGAGSPAGLPGDAMLLDHCHLTFAGNHRVAAALAGEVGRILDERGRLAASASRPSEGVPSPERVAELLAWTDWERYRVAEATARQHALPPFTGQCDHASRQKALAARVDALRARTRPDAHERILKACRDALARRENDLLLRANYARCLYAFGRAAPAAEQWARLTDLLPRTAEYATQHGICLLQQGRPGEAIQRFRAALVVLPRDLNARSNLAAALLYAGRADEAVDAARDVLAAAPDHADARTNLGIALARRGDEDAAAGAFRAVLEQDPAHSGALRNYAKLLTGRGRRDEAVELYRRALAAREDTTIRLDLAGTLLAEGRTADAIAECRRAAEAAPNAAPAHLALGRALLAAGKYRPAADALAEAVRLDGSLAAAHRDLGAALQRLDRPAEAMDHYRRALAAAPGDWTSRDRLAWLLMRRGRLAEAVDQYREVLAARPDHAAAHNNLAVALTKLNRVREAVGHFAAAVRIEPTPMRHFNLATRLARLGDDGQAVEHFRRALAMKPGWADAAEELAWLLATSEDRAVRDGPAAVRLATLAVRASGSKSPGPLDALAAALAETGDFERAAATARRARAHALALGREDTAARIARRVELYESGRPCRREMRQR